MIRGSEKQESDHQKAYHREYYQNHREEILSESRERYAKDPKLRAAKSLYRREWWGRLKEDLNSPAFKTHILRRARHRARKCGLDFNLSLDDVSAPKTCPVFGFPLKSADGRHNDQSPALDRIIPSMGYVKGNAVVISQRANVLKRDASLEELEKLVRFLRRVTPKG